MKNRREFIKNVGLTGLGISLIPQIGFGKLMAENTLFELPKLPYAYDALEPLIDAKRWKFTTQNTIRLM